MYIQEFGLAWLGLAWLGWASYYYYFLSSSALQWIDLIDLIDLIDRCDLIWLDSKDNGKNITTTSFLYTE